MNIAEQLAAEQAKIDALDKAMSPADKAEIEAREELAKKREEREEKARTLRGLDLARREDAAREKGGGAAFRSLDLEASVPGAGTFILRTPNAQAWNAFRKAIGDAQADHASAYRSFAIATIQDHDGATWEELRNPNSEAAAKLGAVLTKFPAVAMTIANVGGELAGLADTRKKSGG